MQNKGDFGLYADAVAGFYPTVFPEFSGHGKDRVPSETHGLFHTRRGSQVCKIRKSDRTQDYRAWGRRSCTCNEAPAESGTDLQGASKHCPDRRFMLRCGDNTPERRRHRRADLSGAGHRFEAF